MFDENQLNNQIPKAQYDGKDMDPLLEMFAESTERMSLVEEGFYIPLTSRLRFNQDRNGPSNPDAESELFPYDKDRQRATFGISTVLNSNRRHTEFYASVVNPYYVNELVAGKKQIRQEEVSWGMRHYTPHSSNDRLERALDRTRVVSLHAISIYVKEPVTHISHQYLFQRCIGVGRGNNKHFLKLTVKKYDEQRQEIGKPSNFDEVPDEVLSVEQFDRVIAEATAHIARRKKDTEKGSSQ